MPKCQQTKGQVGLLLLLLELNVHGKALEWTWNLRRGLMGP